MTLIESGPRGTFPPRELLETSPVGSRVVLRYAAGVRSVFSKASDGLWYGITILPATPHHALIRKPLSGALSSRVFDVFDRETWRLHHPGLVRVVLSSGSRWWVCDVCHDQSLIPFDSIPAAGDDARAHVANHVEIARAL